MSATEFVETAGGLVSEDVPSLTDFAEEVGGPLQPGWYDAEVLEGYATRSGKQFMTGDTVSNRGDSRNMTICYRVSPKVGEPRNLFERVNYRASDLTVERLAYIKEARDEFKGVAKWSDSDAQRSSLAIATLGQIEKSIGFTFKRSPAGNLTPAPLVGQKLSIRLKIDGNGYNEVTGHAKLGTAPKGTGK